jgi:PAS domain S-box-containing protein
VIIDQNIYRTVFNCSPVGEYLLTPTPDATILAVNETFLRTVARTREDLVGKRLFDAFPANPDDPQDSGVAVLHQSLIKVIATGLPDVMPLQRYPITVRLPDGSERYEERFWSASNTPIFDEHKKLICISHRTTDVTERKHAEDIVQRQAARQAFQLAFADRIRPLADPEEVTAAANELLGKHLGVKRVVYGETDEAGEQLVLNRDWTDGTFMSMADMQLRLDDYGSLVIDVLRAGEVLAVDDVTIHEQTARYANVYLATGIRSILGIPLMKSGRLRAILCIHDSTARHWTSEDISLAQDVVDRTWFAVESVRAHAESRAERDQSQLVFDSMTEGFALLDRDWTILRINETGAKATRRSLAELLGRDHWEVLPGFAGTEVEALYRRTQESGIAETIEVQHTFPGGTKDWLEVRAYPLPEGRLAVFFRNIAARKSAEQKLREADQRKDEFLAMLAHELRNPLAPIGSAAQLLQMVKLDEERVRSTSQIINRQVDHMTHLINDLLDVSRVTRGLVELDNAPLDIRHIVNDAVVQVTPLIQSRGHHLALYLPPDTTIVMGDEKRLVQVIANILNNAAKYTNQGGSIVLKTDVRESHVLIEIIDNGIGMTDALAAHAFDLFAQAERTSDRSAGGLGLGLALVKSLVELHGGTVTCESPGIGKGSKFTVCLPRLVASAQPDESVESADATWPHASRSLLILIVDDNVDAATMLAMLLEASGHQVLVEHRPQGALERVKTVAPDVCLLDIGLPDMDGNELARHLRKQPNTANAVLMAVTGYGQESDRKRTQEAGFDHHLIKPVDTKKLASILADISVNNRHQK